MRLSEYLKDRRVVLASGSPRRKELLAQIGIFPEVLPSNAEENTRETRPECLVMELAERKALDVAAGCGKDTLVIGADTVVSIDGEILGKPGTPERAVRMIEKLSGRSHQVYTGVCLLGKGLEGGKHAFSPRRPRFMYIPWTRMRSVSMRTARSRWIKREDTASRDGLPRIYRGLKEIMEMWWGCLWAVSAMP